MARCRADFLVEPFVEGAPGEHVTAAIAAAQSAGLALEVGPFGTMVQGDPTSVLTAIGKAVEAALQHGATRVSVNIDVER